MLTDANMVVLLSNKGVEGEGLEQEQVALTLWRKTAPTLWVTCSSAFSPEDAWQNHAETRSTMTGTKAEEGFAWWLCQALKQGHGRAELRFHGE